MAIRRKKDDSVVQLLEETAEVPGERTSELIGGSGADLASAARQKPAEPTKSTADARPTGDSNLALREADMVLNEFRQQMRADLRTQAYRSTMPSETVPELRRQLDLVRASIRDSLRR